MAMANSGEPQIIYSGNGCPSGTLNPVLQFNFLHFYPNHLNAAMGPQIPAEENQKECIVELNSDGSRYEFAVTLEVMRGTADLDEGVNASITASAMLHGHEEIEVGNFVVSGPNDQDFSFSSDSSQPVWSECVAGGVLDIKTEVKLDGESGNDNTVTIRGPVVYKVHLRRC
jgi:hypothetical protein